MPHERDADAAATRYAAKLGIRPETLPAAGDRSLHSAQWPAPDRGSLAARVFAFSLFYPDRFETTDATNDPADQLSTAELLDALVVPDGARAWQQLRANHMSDIETIRKPIECTMNEWLAIPEARRHQIADQAVADLAAREAKIVESVAQHANREFSPPISFRACACFRASTSSPSRTRMLLPRARTACYRLSDVLVYAVVDDALSADFPLGDSLEVFTRREDAERFVEEVRRDAPEAAASCGSRSASSRALVD